MSCALTRHSHPWLETWPGFSRRAVAPVPSDGGRMRLTSASLDVLTYRVISVETRLFQNEPSTPSSNSVERSGLRWRLPSALKTAPGISPLSPNARVDEKY